MVQFAIYYYRMLLHQLARFLPLVYVIDSILKNVKGLYIDVMRKDIAQWMESNLFIRFSLLASSAGIDLQNDGSLNISLTLRKHLQAVLDDIQADVVELKKVSL